MEETLQIKEENPRCSIKLEIKQEVDDVPDFVDINDYSSEQNEKGSSKQLQFHHCVTCGNKYRKADYLQLHQAVHDSERFCPVCTTTFTDKRKFVSHVNQHIKTKMKEDKEKECVCSYCQKKFGTRRRLQLHVRVHTGERPHKCEICGEFFKLLGALKDHQVTHTRKKEYVCEICKGEYTTSSSLNRHMKRTHKTKKTFDCEQCEIKFSSLRSLNCHQKKVHFAKDRQSYSGVDTKRKCHNCEAVFDNRDEFEEHKKTLCHKHIEYECLLCGDLLSNLYSYSEHKRQHMGYTREEYEDNKRLQYPCKYCSKSFTSIQNVFRHLHVHMEKTDQCHLCYDYYSKYGLKKHMIRCHKALQCKVCLEFELGKHKLYRHYQKYHTTAVKKFCCKICNGQYMTKKALYIHHRIVHDKNKYLQCSLCGVKAFFTTDIAKHMTSNHMVNNKYYCPLCDVYVSNRKEILWHNSYHKQMKKQVDGSIAPKHRLERSQLSKKYWTVKQNGPKKCPKCSKISTTLLSYKSHNKSCENKIELERKKLKCKRCCRVLCNTLSYKKHIEFHAKDILECKSCGTAFDNLVVMRKHRLSFHKDSYRFWCILCNNDFKKFNEYTRHKLGHYKKNKLIIKMTVLSQH